MRNARPMDKWPTEKLLEQRRYFTARATNLRNSREARIDADRCAQHITDILEARRVVQSISH